MQRNLFLSTLILLVLIIAIPANVKPIYANRTSSVYTSREQMIAQWKELCDVHPQWASYESIGKSIKGKDIWLFKIGTPSGGRIMYDGQGHGSEDGGTELLFKFCKWLLESNEPLANHILRYNYHLIIPILNVDTTARQNMRRQYVLENGTINVPYGVDLNRNGIYRWGQSGSVDPNDNYSYSGLYGGSEPETMAYHNAAGEYRPDIYVNTHNGGEYMMHYSNDPLEQNIKTLKSQYEQQYNITNPYPANQGGRGGYIAVDVDGSWGASGWLWEVTLWENLTPTLDEWLSLYYPRALPVLLAFAKAVEKAPEPEYPEITPSPKGNDISKSIPNVNLSNHAINITVHDIIVTNLTTSSKLINQGETVTIGVNVLNNGSFTETFNLTIYANNFYITSEQITITEGNLTAINFTWNTTNFIKGNYTLRAYAWPITNEINTTNNTFELTGQQIIAVPAGEKNTTDYYKIALLPLLIFTTITSALILKKRKLKPVLKASKL